MYILAINACAEMKDTLNTRIKKREAFRPFAPSILEERVGEYFEQSHPAPTMLMVYQIRPEKRTTIHAVTHVDGSGRLQIVPTAPIRVITTVSVSSTSFRGAGRAQHVLQRGRAYCVHAG